MKHKKENAIGQGEGIFTIIAIIAIALAIYSNTHRVVPVEYPDAEVITAQ